MATLTAQSNRSNDTKLSLSAIENFVLSGIAAVGIYSPFYKLSITHSTKYTGSKTAAAPLERIKLLIQNQKEMIKSQRLNTSYSSPMHCFKTILSEEGILSLWRGNLANCIRYLPSQALNFTYKERIKEQFQISDSDSALNKLSKNTISGALAGLLSLTCVYSLDFTRTRLANDVLMEGRNRQYNGLLDVYKQTLKSDGFIGLYRGFVISCYTVIFYRGIYFGMYDTLQPILFANDDDKSHFFGSFALGFGITTVAGVIVYPLDTVRRRMMMRSGEIDKYKGSVDCFQSIVRAEGGKSLYRGCVVNIFRNVSGAGTLASFDLMKRHYKKYKHNRD